MERGVKLTVHADVVEGHDGVVAPIAVDGHLHGAERSLHMLLYVLAPLVAGGVVGAGA